MKTRHPRIIVVAMILGLVLLSSGVAQVPDRFNEDLLKPFTFRNLGPFRAGSWVTSFAVPTVPARDHLYTFYVGTRNGGVWKTVNGGTTFEPVFDGQPKLSIGDVAVAPTDANLVYVGTGEAYCARSSHAGDGMYNQVDPTDSRWVYNNREFGAMWRLDQKTGIQTAIQPRRTTGEPLRFNWTPPIQLSPHNPAILYVGAQVLFRSLDRGDHWEEISPDLTTNEKAKQGGAGNITYCTIFSVSESPRKAGVLWVGADDGKVQMTRDGGATWHDRTASLTAAGAPANFWVSRVFASPHDAGTAFVAKSGMRFDDFRSCLYKTTNYGDTWTSIAGNLPNDRSINVVVQDRKNPDLLFVGTEQGIFVTIDGGARWLPLKNNMPSVKVTDLMIHPRENDLVAGTYGRGVWITDITPLQEMKAGVFEEDAYMFDIEPTTQRIYGGIGNYQLLGDSHLFTPNEPNAVVINYYLKNRAAGPVKITVADPYGQVLAELNGKGARGINSAQWNMRGRAAGGRGGGLGGAMADPGEYVVTLEAAGKKMTKRAVIRYRQGWTVGAAPVVIQKTERK